MSRNINTELDSARDLRRPDRKTLLLKWTEPHSLPTS